MPRPWLYRAYGLVVSSSVELPVLPPADAGTPDVRIRPGTIGLARPRRQWAGFRVRAAPRQVHLVFDEVGGCLVRRDEVLLDLVREPELKALQLLLVGPVTGILLQLRGLLVLHAAAVEVDGAAVVIAGNSGMGKSTTAAALVRDGGRMLSDDVVALEVSGSTVTVLSGSPHLRLMPESLLALGEDPAGLPRLRDALEKRQLAGPGGGQRTPLAALFVLEDAALLGADPVEPAAAMEPLLVQSYCADLLRGAGAARHFRQCGVIASSGRVHRLRRPRSLARLGDLSAEVRRAAGVGAPA